MANNSSNLSVPTWATIMVAFVAIAWYFAMVVLLYVNRGLIDTEWSRLVSLFTGIQAVAFSAFGWALGTQVGQGAVIVAREQATAAQRQVEKTQQELTQAAVQRTASDLKAAESLEKGHRLTRQIIRDRQGTVPDSQAEGVAPGVSDETILLAKALFPEIFEQSDGR